MNAKLLTGAATFLLGRSRRFRWLVPAIPLAIAAYRFLQQRRAPTAEAEQLTPLVSDVPTVDLHAAPSAIPASVRRKRASVSRMRSQR